MISVINYLDFILAFIFCIRPFAMVFGSFCFTDHYNFHDDLSHFLANKYNTYLCYCTAGFFLFNWTFTKAICCFIFALKSLH